MKTLLTRCGFLGLLLLSAAVAPGQGTVNFNNRVVGQLVTRVYGPESGNQWLPKFGNTASDTPSGTQIYSGALVSGSNWRAQLFAAPGADQPESALQPAFPTTTFRTGTAAGNLANGVTATLTGVPVDCPVATVQMRVWDNSSGLYPDWPSAMNGWNAATIAVGKSLRFNVTAIGGGTNPPATMLNLQSFNTYFVGLDIPVLPYFYTQPKSQSVPVGGNASFSVEVSCPAAIQFYWQKSGNTIANGYSNSFPYLLELPITNAQPSQAGVYSLKVVNACCLCCTNFYPLDTLTTNSTSAVLTVGNPGVLNVTRDQVGRAVMNWDSVFYLQSATNVAGPFTDLPGQIVLGPYTNFDLHGARFFRLRN